MKSKFLLTMGLLLFVMSLSFGSISGDVQKIDNGICVFLQVDDVSVLLDMPGVHQAHETYAYLAVDSYQKAPVETVAISERNKGPGDMTSVHPRIEQENASSILVLELGTEANLDRLWPQSHGVRKARDGLAKALNRSQVQVTKQLA